MNLSSVHRHDQAIFCFWDIYLAALSASDHICKYWFKEQEQDISVIVLETSFIH